MVDMQILIGLELISDRTSLITINFQRWILHLWSKASTATTFKLSDAEKIEVIAGFDLPSTELNKPYILEVESIWFEKKK